MTPPWRIDGSVVDPLRAELTALARRLTARGIVLTVGGGFGLVLKREHIAAHGLRTRFIDPPYTRSTNDVDCFLTADLISDAGATREIRDALDALGYTPVDGAKYYQFARTIDYDGTPVPVKFDFLAPPVTGEPASRVKSDARRIRPRGFSEFHAHTAPEASTVGDSPTTVELGAPGAPATVRLPHPFTYLLLKLHAFRDQVDDPGRDNGRHHAFDIYATVALATESEWREMRQLMERHAADPSVVEAMRIRAALFDEMTALGPLRLREHAAAARISLPAPRIGDLLEDLRDIFASR